MKSIAVGLLAAVLAGSVSCHAVASYESLNGTQVEPDAAISGDGPAGVDIDAGASDALGPDAGSSDGLAAEGDLAAEGGLVDGIPVVASDASAGSDGGQGGGALQIISSPLPVASPMSTYKYDAEVNTTAPVYWSLKVAPSGMTVDSATGLVQWPAAFGVYSVTLHVTDGVDSDEQSWTVVVKLLLNGLPPAALASWTREGLGARLARGALRGEQLDATLREALAEPGRARVLSKIVGCALSPTDALRLRTSGGTLRMVGEVGLAPEWREQSCNARCQQIVSGCVAARVNAEGKRVPIALALPADELPAGSSDPRTEGLFFGNLFASPPRLFACSRLRGAALAPGRRCTVAGGCPPISAVGGCEATCVVREGRGLSCRGGDGSYRHPVEVRVP